MQQETQQSFVTQHVCEESTDLMSPPHHQIGENSDPQDGADKRHGKESPGCLKNMKDVYGTNKGWQDEQFKNILKK